MEIYKYVYTKPHFPVNMAKLDISEGKKRTHWPTKPAVTQEINYTVYMGQHVSVRPQERWWFLSFAIPCMGPLFWSTYIYIYYTLININNIYIYIISYLIVYYMCLRFTARSSNWARLATSGLSPPIHGMAQHRNESVEWRGGSLTNHI